MVMRNMRGTQKRSNWGLQVGVKGDIGTNVPVPIPSNANGRAFEFMVFAGSANDDATLKISRSNDTGSVIGDAMFDGYLNNTDSDNIITFPDGEFSSGSFFVNVTGGSGSVIVLSRMS